MFSTPKFSTLKRPVLELPALPRARDVLVFGLSALVLLLAAQQASGQIAPAEKEGVGVSEAAAEPRGTSMEEVIVYGRAKQFYLQQKTSVGSKLDLDLLQLPQSAQVLTEQLMLDQAARATTDLYRSIAGVSEFSFSGVTFRGFRDSDNVFYDGVRGDAYFGFSVPQLFNVERLEVLKGPSAALYGGGEPGGMLNYVTKKPQFERFNELTITGGNYDLMGASLDSRGTVTERVAYRLAGFYEEQDSFRDNADSMNLQLAGGLLFEPSDATRFTGTFEYVEQDLGGHRLRGVPATDEGDFIVGREFNTNEAFDEQTLEALVFQGVIEHRFTEVFRVKATARYLPKSDREQAYHEPRGWVDANGDSEANADDGVIARQYRDQFRSDEAFSLTTDFFYNFEWAGVPHQFLFGGDVFSVDSDFDFLVATGERDGVVDLNIFQPNYGSPIRPVTVSSMSPYRGESACATVSICRTTRG
ncbi:MAG: TonB-dependent receptor plug domain-containing protein [Halioglobus sp.]|nr:TonB-dependent receptor plug domain-containing protein [Halioglobus sp.]